MANDETKRYMQELAQALDPRNSGALELVEKVPGNRHAPNPKLAVFFGKPVPNLLASAKTKDYVATLSSAVNFTVLEIVTGNRHIPRRGWKSWSVWPPVVHAWEFACNGCLLSLDAIYLLPN